MKDVLKRSHVSVGRVVAWQNQEIKLVCVSWENGVADGTFQAVG
ncbi:hypothetical protein l11_13240 [Neisseria weaveri LMG 5135]|nr:hypothetical protein l13_04720 [Neisseria weaveri ATCC 51223]EGV37221.1 hypothetical protein l11_13240 [Neisseria weaveri LMG 5135]